MTDGRKRMALALLLVACGDNLTEPTPDAPPPDPPSPCCSLLPDEDAVRACTPPLPPDTCGVIACPLDGGGFTRINVCGPRTRRTP